jgi:hypothetical protein
MRNYSAFIYSLLVVSIVARVGAQARLVSLRLVADAVAVLLAGAWVRVVGVARGLRNLALEIAGLVRALAESLHLRNLLTVSLGEEFNLQGPASHLDSFTGLQGHSLL